MFIVWTKNKRIISSEKLRIATINHLNKSPGLIYIMRPGRVWKIFYRAIT